MRRAILPPPISGIAYHVRCRWGTGGAGPSLPTSPLLDPAKRARPCNKDAERPSRKFGKHLQKRQLDIPEYAASFVNYKALKKVRRRSGKDAALDREPTCLTGTCD